jgi:Glycosyltransferases, probably involved in cell wall biogenesis
MKYVLITPAHNEEAFIDKTLASMAAQTVLPERWVIVDDGSSDRTAEIIQRYARRFSWIRLVQRPPRLDRSFAGKVHAFNAGLEQVQSVPFEVIGNLDADLSFEPDYLEFLIGKFAEDPQLGVAGTPFTENGGYDTARDSFEGENHVAGGCQLFRRQCFEDVGGYTPNPAGGIDWIAVTTARMKGWRTRSFPEKRFHHYRTLGTAGRGPLRALYSYGGKRLLPRGFTGLAIVPRSISDDKETDSAGRTCLALRLCLGRIATCQPRGFAGVNASSSA